MTAGERIPMDTTEAAGRFDDQLPPEEPREVQVPHPDARKLLQVEHASRINRARSASADPPNGGGPT